MYEEDESLLKLIINECSQLYNFNDAIVPEPTDLVEAKLQKSNILQLKGKTTICIVYKLLFVLNCIEYNKKSDIK